MIVTTAPINVTDSAFVPERVQTYAQSLSRSPQLLKMFEACYRGKRKAPLDSNYLARSTGFSKKRANELATRLAQLNLLVQPRPHAAVYERIIGVAAVKDKIIRYATNPKAASKQVTFRSNHSSQVIVKRIRIPVPHRAKVVQITIDDIAEFSEVRGIGPAPAESLPKALPEETFKKALIALLPGTEGSKDWGGERNDIFSTHIRIKDKRVSAAFALKGPAARSTLTPKKMGKNGDQIQRLVILAPVQLFVIQYEGKIDQSVYEQLSYMVQAKASLTGDPLYYCVIDGADSYRLRSAYPSKFSSPRR